MACHFHYTARREAGRWEATPDCKQRYWNACRDMSCNWHLASKRIQKIFPGNTQSWHWNLRDALKHDQGTKECHLTEWYACLHNDCQKHMRQKTQNVVISHVRGRHEQINILTPKQFLCATQYDTHVNIPVMINGQRTIAMIDSGATGNFVSRDLVRSVDLPTRRKEDQYDLQMADGSTLSTGRIDEETYSLPVTIQRHHEELTFDVVGMATHYIILGMPWLKKHNPAINWQKGVLTFANTGDVASIQPIRRQWTTIDEKRNRRPVEACIASVLKKDDLKRGSDSARTSKGQQGE